MLLPCAGSHNIEFSKMLALFFFFLSFFFLFPPSQIWFTPGFLLSGFGSRDFGEMDAVRIRFHSCSPGIWPLCHMDHERVLLLFFLVVPCGRGSESKATSITNRDEGSNLLFERLLIVPNLIKKRLEISGPCHQSF